MIEESTLGNLVRERRLAAGYSLGQLASKVGKTAAVVREWERGEGYPDPDLVERLAETLEIDRGEIAALVPPPPEPEAAAVAAVEDMPPAEAAAVEDVPQMDAALDLEGLWGPDDEAAQADEPPPLPSVPDITDAPTEAIFPPVGAVAFPAPIPEPSVEAPVVAVPVSATPAAAQGPWDVWIAPLRSIFDPQQRWLYWIRATLTVVVFFVLFLVLAWAVKELFTALSEFLDSIEPTDSADEVVGFLTGGGIAG